MATATTDDGRRGEGAYSNALLAAQLGETYASLGNSLPFRRGIVNAVGLDPNAPEYTDAVVVSPVANTGVIEIGAQAADPQVAGALAQAAADRLLEQIERTSAEAPGEARVTAAAISGSSPPLPEPAGRFKAVVSGVILGLLAGLGLILTTQLVQRRVFTDRQAVEVAKQPCLGKISKNGNVSKELVQVGDRGRGSEEFRALRSALEAASDDRAHRVTLATSPLDGAGTTTVVAGIGAVLGDAGKRVLLVDANLRNSALSQLTGVADAPAGLTDVISGSPVADAIRQWRGIDVLPAGQTAAVPSDLFDSPQARMLWSSLSDAYDFVLVDSAAFLPFSDSHPLASAADQALIVVDSGATKVVDVDRTVRDIAQLGTPLVGTVLNRTRGSDRVARQR